MDHLRFNVIIVLDPMVKNNRSFTLIEILIVTSIIIILSGISLVAMSSFKDDRLLNGQAGTFVQALEFARDKAAAGDTSLCSESGSAYVDGYSVVVNPTGIILLPGCNTTPSPVVYRVEKNIVFLTPTLSVRFDAQKYQGDTVDITLKNNISNKCNMVTVNDSGLITNASTPCP